jgi:DNA transformation protein
MDSFLALVLEQLREFSGVTWRRLFSGWSLCAGGLHFGIVYDGRLYFKTDEAGRAPFQDRGMGPFRPGAEGDVALISYWEVPADVLEEPELLATWADRAVAAARAAKAAKAARPRRRSR